MPDTLAGKKLKCKKCEGPIQVPAVEAAPEEPTKVSPNAVVKAATILRAEPDMGGSGSDPAEAPKRNRKPEKETESSATEAKAARQKAKRDAKAKQSRRAVKGCLLIALGLLVVGAGVAAYYLYYPLLDRKVHAANLFRQYKSVEKSLESTSDEKAKMDLKLKKLAIFMTVESNPLTDDQKNNLREHFKEDWPKYGKAFDEIWERQAKFTQEQERKNNPEKYAPSIAWDAKPDPGFALVIQDDPKASKSLLAGAKVVFPATSSAFVMVQTNKPSAEVVDLRTMKPFGPLFQYEEYVPYRLSPDGKCVACKSKYGAPGISVYSVQSGEKIAAAPSAIFKRVFDDFISATQLLTVDDDVTPESDQTLTILSLDTKTSRTFKLPPIEKAMLSRGGRYLLGIRRKMNRIAVIDLEKEKIVGELMCGNSENGIRLVNNLRGIATTTDGSLIAALILTPAATYRIIAWNAETGQETSTVNIPPKAHGYSGNSDSLQSNLDWLPGNSGWLVNKHLLIDPQGQHSGILPIAETGTLVPRTFLAGGFYLDLQGGGPGKSSKLTFEKLPVK